MVAVCGYLYRSCISICTCAKIPFQEINKEDYFGYTTTYDGYYKYTFC